MSLQRFSHLTLLFGLLLALTACAPYTDDDTSTDKAFIASQMTQGLDCPPIKIVEDKRALSQFTDDFAPRVDNAISSVRILGVGTTCKHNPGNIAVDLDITFASTRGPKAGMADGATGGFEYPYFVAIAMPSGGVVAREVFTVTVPSRAGYNTTTHHEHMHQVIPVHDGVKPDQLLVGLQLTPAQEAYNRSLAGLQNTAAGPVAPDVVKKKPVVAKKKTVPHKKKTKPKTHAKPKTLTMPKVRVQTPEPVINVPAFGPASVQ